jgi:hypothetical protein
VQGSNLLPNVNPAFSWVRLAQRIPVRVALDEVPPDFRMIAGRTATVSMRDLSLVGRPVAASGVSVASGVSAAPGVSVAPAAPAASAPSGSSAAASSVK